MGTEYSGHDDPSDGAKGDGRNACCGGLAYRRNTGCLAAKAMHSPSAAKSAKTPDFGNFHSNPRKVSKIGATVKSR